MRGILDLKLGTALGRGLLIGTALGCSPLQAQETQSAVTAEDSAESGSGDIIVTARKREEKAIDVPASLNVFGGEALRSSGVNSLADLQYQTPGLKIGNAAGNPRISLRGVGNNISSGSPSVAVHLDDIYIPRPRFALAETFDVGRIEVLKGPEGTLYGRNATGGAINIVSADPDDRLGGFGYVGYGSRNLVTAQAGVSIPLGDSGGVRLSGVYANDDGYTRNLNPVGGEIDNRDYKGVRLRGKFGLTENLEVAFTAQYVDDEGTIGFGSTNNPASPVFASDPPAQRTGPRRINVDTVPIADAEGVLLSGTVRLRLGTVTLRSITGYFDYKTRDQYDIDGSGGFIAIGDANSRSKLFSQEFQISGGSEQGLSWTGGVYYARERNRSTNIETDADFPDPNPYIFTDLRQRLRTRSAAVFGEATLALGDQFSIIGGARYTEEKQSGSSTLDGLFFPQTIRASGDIKSKAFTPKVVLEYRPYEGGRLYASATRGFKSGGVNLSTSATVYRPEKIWAYEVGSKNEFMNGMGEFSLAGFYYDYTDLQLRTTLFTPDGIFVRITNAAKAEIYGVEAALVVRPARGLSFDANGAYLHSELKNFISPVTRTEIKGLPLPLAPKWSFTAGAQYQAELGSAGKLTARGEVNYQSSVIFPQFTDLARERQSGYALVNANLRYDFPGERYYLALIGRNLTNKAYLTQRFFFAGFADTEFYGTPRTVEIRAGARF
jgi:iron complex outermembrane recepter protein